jgi:hypothetical protein
MVVVENYSSVDETSVSIFIATTNGVYIIDTDESNIGSSETNYRIKGYGVAGSGNDYEIIKGESNSFSAIDVNNRLNYMYVVNNTHGTVALTYIDLATNTSTAHIPEARLLNKDIRSLSFKD